MTIYERSETYVHVIEFMNDSGSYYDPDEIKITIKSPCDTILVNNLDMAKTETGHYTYSYTLLDTAIYGQYSVSVKSTVGTDIAVEPNKFFVMPWNITDEIRTLTGQTEKKISDDDLSLMAWYAYIETRDRVMELHYREKLCCCIYGIYSCCTKIECECFCGTSSPSCPDGYKLKNNPIADYNNDDNVHGCECDDVNDECQNDICVIWKNNDGECQSGSVKVESASCGEVKVYQSDCSTPIPVDNEGILITYRSVWETFTMWKFKKAVAYLAAYELALRYNLSSKTVAGCDEKAKVSFSDRLYIRYRDIVESISKPAIGGGK